MATQRVELAAACVMGTRSKRSLTARCRQRSKPTPAPNPIPKATSATKRGLSFITWISSIGEKHLTRYTPRFAAYPN